MCLDCALVFKAGERGGIVVELHRPSKAVESRRGAVLTLHLARVALR